jgi:hypothetical protein
MNSGLDDATVLERYRKPFQRVGLPIMAEQYSRGKKRE